MNNFVWCVFQTWKERDCDPVQLLRILKDEASANRYRDEEAVKYPWSTVYVEAWEIE